MKKRLVVLLSIFLAFAGIASAKGGDPEMTGQWELFLQLKSVRGVTGEVFEISDVLSINIETPTQSSSTPVPTVSMGTTGYVLHGSIYNFESDVYFNVWKNGEGGRKMVDVTVTINNPSLLERSQQIIVSCRMYILNDMASATYATGSCQGYHNAVIDGYSQHETLYGGAGQLMRPGGKG